jgi:hypothetical protein
MTTAGGTDCYCLFFQRSECKRAVHNIVTRTA